MSFTHRKLDPKEIAQVIRSFVDGTAGPRDWDDFTSIPIGDRKLDAIRKYANDIYDLFPAKEPGTYCNPGGTAELKRIAALLEGGEEYEIDEDGIPQVILRS